jgi:hypothetical protein
MNSNLEEYLFGYAGKLQRIIARERTLGLTEENFGGGGEV